MQYLAMMALMSASILSYAQSATVLEGAQGQVYKKIADTELKLHIFKPTETDNGALRPAMIFFFGGGWTSGTVTQFVPHAKYFADRGIVTIVADYRVRSRHGVTPFECVADAKSAVRWLRQHAAKYRINPNKIVAAGGSAGGHLAASTALLEGLDEAGEDQRVSAMPNALVLFNPALDMTELRRYMLADSVRAEVISPLHHVRKGVPPTIIFHGTSDTTVPFGQATRFCEAMKKYGDRCEVVAFEGRGHGFFNAARGSGADHRATLEKTQAFLVSIGYISPDWDRN